jgi:riboflavin biosynthesis pyrimidine reductase
MFNLPGIERLADARRLRLVDVAQVGDDVRLRARF